MGHIFLMILKQLLEENNLHFDDKFYEDCEVFVKLLQCGEKFITLVEDSQEVILRIFGFFISFKFYR